MTDPSFVRAQECLDEAKAKTDRMLMRLRGTEPATMGPIRVGTPPVMRPKPTVRAPGG